ncbi:MAG: hypothetical protein WC358_00620 [Ignavibacteria bacterium]|jgi:hypothetical protein
MLKRLANWLRVKLLGIKPGIDIEIIGTVAIIRIDAGRLPPQKAEEYAKRNAELFTAEIKAAMGITAAIFVPYTRG